MEGENVSKEKTSGCSCGCSNGGCSKVLLPAFVITIIGTMIGFLTCGWLFNWIYAIEPVSVWKMPTANTLIIDFIGTFVLSIILVCVFVKLYNSIPYQGWKKGVKFGFLVWLISTLPGMFATYMWTNVAFVWIVYSLIMGLIVLLIKGAVIGAMYKK